MQVQCVYVYICMYMYEYVRVYASVPLGCPSSGPTSAHVGCLLWVSASTYIKNPAVSVPTPVTWRQIQEACERNAGYGAALPSNNRLWAEPVDMADSPVLAQKCWLRSAFRLAGVRMPAPTPVASQSRGLLLWDG